MGGAQSKLYTEAWWNFGYVGQSGTTAYNVTAEYSMDFADLGAYYTATANDDANVDMNEVTLSVAKSFGALDTALAYIYTEADDGFNDVQLYLTYNFQKNAPAFQGHRKPKQMKATNLSGIGTKTFAAEQEA